MSANTARLALSQRQTVSVLALLTAGSQGLGLIRDFLLARAFSITAELEGYFFAEAIPLAVTVMFVTIVPLTVLPRFVRLRLESVARCDADYRMLLRLAAALLLPVLGAILLLAPQIIDLVGGALSPESKQVAGLVLRVLAVNVVGIPFLSLNTAYLNAKGGFVLPAAALLLMNLGAILGLQLGHTITTVAIGSSVGTVLAVVGTWLIIQAQLTSARIRSGAWTRRFSPNLVYMIVYVAMLSLIVLLERRLSSLSGFGAVTLVAYVTKVVGVPQHLFTMSYVRVRIAQYSRWISLGDRQAVRRDFLRSIGVMAGVAVVCAAAAALGGIRLAELLFGTLTAKQAGDFQQAIIILSAALLPMFVNALFVGLASAYARLDLLMWPSIAQAVVLATAALTMPQDLGAPVVAGVLACGYIAASLVWLAMPRFLLTSRTRAGRLSSAGQ